MLAVSKIVAQSMLSFNDLTTIVGQKVFPLIADQEVDEPFVVYQVDQLPLVTKDDAKEYIVTIKSHHSTYDKALLLHEKVNEAMVAASFENTKYTFRNGGAFSQVTEEENIVIIQKFNLKK